MASMNWARKTMIRDNYDSWQYDDRNPKNSTRYWEDRPAKPVIEKPVAPEVPPGHKFCFSCATVLAHAGFYRNPNTEDKLHTRCRKCEEVIRRARSRK